MTDEKCPRCKEGIIQRTALTPPNKGEAIGCNRCPYPLGEPGLSYDPLEVDEGWEPPYRNKNACLEQVKQAVAPMWHNIDALQKELEVAQSLHKVAVRERDYERTLCDNFKDQWLKKVKQLEKCQEDIDIRTREIYKLAHFMKVFFLASTSWKTTQEQQ